MARFIVWLVRFYQRRLNPEGSLFRFFFLSERACRFQPTCSSYLIEAVEKYGVWGGLARGLRRLLKCHPLNAGGCDPVG